jgi:hypothetical protein
VVTVAATKTTTSMKPAPVMKDYTGWRKNLARPMTLAEARRIAFDMHAKQADKVGRPYREHLTAVERGVVVLGGSTEERIAALFHDAVEDHHTTYEHLSALGVTEATVTMIEAVSKRKNEEQGKYLARIIAAGHGAVRVKVADLLHNTRHDRMAAIKDTYTRERLQKKYRPALASLLLALELLTDEEGQRKLATKPLGTATGSSTGNYRSNYTGSYTGGYTSGADQTYAVNMLQSGDWPVGWDAPILTKEHGTGESTYVLANGEVRTETWDTAGKNRKPRRVAVIASHRWKYGEVPTGVTAQDRRDYREAVQDARWAGVG